MLVFHPEINSNQIILPIDEWNIIVGKLEKIEEIKIELKKGLKGKGIFKKYANPELVGKEKEAWAIAAVEKYENN